MRASWGACRCRRATGWAPGWGWTEAGATPLSGLWDLSRVLWVVCVAMCVWCVDVDVGTEREVIDKEELRAVPLEEEGGESWL